MKGRVVGGLALAGMVSAWAVSYLRGRSAVLRHVEEYAVHWNERADAPDGVLHYVALGDSVAQGVGASEVRKGYVPLIAERIAERTGREVVVTNLSVSGATTADVVQHQLPRFRRLPFTAEIVTLDIGANDVVFPGHTVASFEANLEVILAALPEGSFVADVPWFPVPVWGRWAQQMSGRAAELADQHGHHLVPVHKAARDVKVWAYYLYVAPDLFHPNDRGYAGWADGFWAEIEASGRLGEFQGD